MNNLAGRALLLALVAAIVPACGNGGGDDVVTVLPGLTLTLTANGGSARGVSTVPDNSYGGFAGAMSVRSTGDIRIGVNAAPAAPAIPAAPTTGTVLSAIAGDITDPGTLILSGQVTTDTGAAVRTITSTGGDVVVSGTLNSGDTLGAAPVNLVINALSGTVYITGSIITMNTDGTADGQAGGSVTINAARIVFQGTIITRGEPHAAGNAGAGGAVRFVIDPLGSDILLSGGSITTTGGSCAGVAANATAGGGGTIDLQAVAGLTIHGTTLTANGGDIASTGHSPVSGQGGILLLRGPAGVVFNGTIHANAGAATGTGAAIGARGNVGGPVLINVGIGASGPVHVYGSISQNGGDTFAASDASAFGDAGPPGTFTIGSTGPAASPSSVDLGAGAYSRNGGDSPDTGGNGGTIEFINDAGTPGSIQALNSSFSANAGTGDRGSFAGGAVRFETRQGDILVQGDISVWGSDNAGTNPVTPGPGGGVSLIAGAGAVTDSGRIECGATIRCSGGSRTGTGNIDGGRGGAVLLSANNPAGSVQTLSSFSVIANGGAATGTATAGAGGTLTIITQNQPISILGTLTANGGTGSATGTGGAGGRLIANSDINNDDVAGPITLESGALVTLNGGDGGVGGHAGSDAAAASATDASAAVVFNADGDAFGAGDNAGQGVVRNNGSIVSLGGNSSGAGPGGRGGDVVFAGDDGSGGLPAAGAQTRTGGTGVTAGQDGDFISQ